MLRLDGEGTPWCPCPVWAPSHPGGSPLPLVLCVCGWQRVGVRATCSDLGVVAKPRPEVKSGLPKAQVLPEQLLVSPGGTLQRGALGCAGAGHPGGQQWGMAMEHTGGSGSRELLTGSSCIVLWVKKCNGVRGWWGPIYRGPSLRGQCDMESSVGRRGVLGPSLRGQHGLKRGPWCCDWCRSLHILFSWHWARGS